MKLIQQDIESVISSLDVALDTNVLLYLYKCSSSTSINLVKQLQKTCSYTIIPYRVYEEYNKHKFQEQAIIDKKYDHFTKEIKQNIQTFETDILKSIS